MRKNIKEILKNVAESVDLSQHCTFKIGGSAKFFYIAKTRNNLLKAVKAAESLKIDYFILGGGSNILVSDNGFDGLVIKVRNDEFYDNGKGIITCGAGMTLGRLVGLAAQRGYGGLKFLAGIPGTVGGAVRGNAGAFGEGFGDLVVSAEIYRDGKVQNLNRDELEFSYRHSVIKERGGVILSVIIKAVPGDKNKIHKEIIDIINLRTNKLPLDKPSAGSFFKNIELAKYDIDTARICQELEVSEEEFKQASKHKLPAGFILEKLDFKGKKIGDAKVSEKHANFIINDGNARADEILMLASDIKMRVRNQLLIQLVEEVQFVGF